MKRIYFTLFALIAISLSVSAQQRYTWEQYGLSFSVPKSFQILENTAESFEAENEEMSLTIELLDYEGLSPEFMGTLLGQMAKDSGMRNAEVGELVLTTLEGAYIEGEIKGVNVIYIVLMDTDSNIALLGSIVYEDGYEVPATRIVNSFAIE
ncbi:hypothetical protein LJB98_05030 [Bacteroidales bacterium OttesenSCG-928-M11]|nr:hypothetical protein [Bacteroidales bacterium OttesenSCG-928-M11]